MLARDPDKIIPLFEFVVDLVTFNPVIYYSLP